MIPSTLVLTLLSTLGACPVEAPSDDPTVEPIRAALSAQPERPRLWSAFADALWNAGDQPAAEACAEVAVARWPDLAGPHLTRGRIALARGDKAAAETHLDLAERKGPRVVRDAVARIRSAQAGPSGEARWRVEGQISAHYDDRADAVAGPFGLSDDADPAATRLGVAVRADRSASGWRFGGEVGRTVYVGSQEVDALDRTRISARAARLGTGGIRSVLDADLTAVLAGRTGSPHVAGLSLGGRWSRADGILWASARAGGLLFAEHAQVDDEATAAWTAVDAGGRLEFGMGRLDGRLIVRARGPGAAGFVEVGAEISPGVVWGPLSVRGLAHASERMTLDGQWTGVLAGGARIGYRWRPARVEIEALQQRLADASFSEARMDRRVVGGRVTVAW